MVKNKYWKLFLEIFLPAYCLSCREEGTFLCNDCQARIEIQKQLVFTDCPDSPYLDGLIAACPYVQNSLLPKLIHAFKYDFVEDLSEPLGELMAQCLRQLSFDYFYFCPVPLHKKRYRWRGFNQAELLAKEAGNRLGLPVLHLLKRVHFNRPQMELSKADRLQNAENAFAPDPAILHSGKINKSLPILLVDDVATTLSTLNSCAKVLKNNGFHKVYGIVLARVY